MTENLGRQLILQKNTIMFHSPNPKILAKKPILYGFLVIFFGNASVSQPSFIILSAPKQELRFCSLLLLLKF